MNESQPADLVSAAIQQHVREAGLDGVPVEVLKAFLDDCLHTFGNAISTLAVHASEQATRTIGRGLHELRHDELPGYLSHVAQNHGPTSAAFLEVASWIVSELARKANDERILARQLERYQSAARTLQSMGYTDEGGELWKPPLGESDPCLAKRESGEPIFTLLGRDPFAMSLVKLWSVARKAFPGKVTAPERIVEANSIAVDMGRWYATRRTDSGTIPDVLDHVPAHILARALSRRGYSMFVDERQHAVIAEAGRSSGAPTAPLHNDTALANAARMSDVMQVQGSSLRPADVSPRSVDLGGGVRQINPAPPNGTLTIVSQSGLTPAAAPTPPCGCKKG